MIAVRVEGLQGFSRLLLTAQADSAGIIRSAIWQGSVLASKLLKQRTAWPEGGSDPFWGKLSPRSGPYLRGRSGMTSSRITGGGVVQQAGVAGKVIYRAQVGSPDQHVAFHEKGGMIPDDFPGYLMSPAGYLRVPTVNAQKPSGEDRYAGQSIRTIPGVFLLTSKKGLLWAAMRVQGVLTLLYLLLRRTGPHRPRGIFAQTTKDVEFAVLRDVNAKIARLTRG